MITREFDLMLYQEGNLLFINANQYDSGEQWIFTLYEENGVKYTPATGAIVGVKSDGKGIINTGTVDEYGRVVINETQQMTAAAGLATFELLIDNDTHGTANFKVDVEPRPSDNADLSDSDLSLIQEAVDSAAVIVDVIGDSDPSEVIGEHVDDWLDAHPEATTTVQDGAITAPKINSTLWDKLLVSEEASGNPASFEDGADDVPVSSLKVALEPIQLGSGDPSPSNVRPIIAANGKNLLQVTGTAQTINGVTFTIDNGVITANGTCTANVSYEVGYTDVTGSLLISGSASGADGTYGLRIGHGNASTFVGRQHGADYAYTASDRVWINIYVFTGVTLNNFKFYPMIRLASITDSSFQPYQGIMVERTGKNLLQLTATSRTLNGVTFTVNSDGTITANGTCTAAAWYQITTVTLNGEYIISGCPSGGSSTTYSIVSQGVQTVTEYGNGATVNYDGTNKIVYIYIYNGATVNNIVFKPMIRNTGTDATFEPYAKATYPYSLGQSVYGGTVDLATGVLTVTYGIVTDFSALASNGTSSTGAYRYKITVADVAGYTVGEAKCNMLKFSAGFNGNAGDFYNGAGVINIFLSDSTVASAITTLTGCQVVYPLSTPQTIQLTPQEVKTLLGYNNISSSGTVDVIYHADTKLYVDKMTNVDNNIIAPTEADFVATRNYTVNDLVIVNDTLYKVTANIASGSTITPNSNVTVTTLGALIKALS